VPADTLTVADVAARYAVRPHAVLGWIRTGELVAVNVARSRSAKRPSWRIPVSSLTAFESARRSAGTVPAVRRRERQKAADVIRFY
jgi:hypothetical protein